MYTLHFLAPFVAGLCFDNFITKQGEFCNIRQESPSVVQYQYPKLEDACYKDGIFYPRCKDLENPQVLYYHNLLYAND